MPDYIKTDPSVCHWKPSTISVSDIRFWWSATTSSHLSDEAFHSHYDSSLAPRLKLSNHHLLASPPKSRTNISLHLCRQKYYLPHHLDIQFVIFRNFFLPTKEVVLVCIFSSPTWLILTYKVSVTVLSCVFYYYYYSSILCSCVGLCARPRFSLCVCLISFFFLVHLLFTRWLSATHTVQPTEFCQYPWLDSPTTSSVLYAYLLAPHTPLHCKMAIFFAWRTSMCRSMNTQRLIQNTAGWS